jgi:hypothetical protein
MSLPGEPRTGGRRGGRALKERDGLGLRHEPAVVGGSSSTSPAGVAAVRHGVLVHLPAI